MSNLALILAFLSALFAALVGVLAKIGLSTVDSTTATAVRSFFMTAFLIIVAWSTGKANLSNIDKRALTFIILSGIAGALSWLAYFAAIKIGRTTAVVAIDKSSVVLVWLLALLFLGESFKVTSLIGVILITIGVILTVL